MVKFEGIDPTPNVTVADGFPTTEHTVAAAPFPDSQIFEKIGLPPPNCCVPTPVRPFPETSVQVLVLVFHDSDVYRACPPLENML